MNKRLIVNLVKYGCCALFVALIGWAYLASREFGKAVLVDQYRYLCDAFTIPGLLLILFGAVLWVSNHGALDGISYCLRFLVFSLIPGKRLEREEKYGDYVERRSQKPVKGYAFLFVSGLASMAVALVFYALFYSLYQ